jgi:hypothetical protein
MVSALIVTLWLLVALGGAGQGSAARTLGTRTA